MQQVPPTYRENLLGNRFRALEENNWNEYLYSNVQTFSGERMTLAEWVHSLIRHKLVPFVNRHGFSLQNEASDYLERQFLHWLYNGAGRDSLPRIKHRNLNKDRWIFESTIPHEKWLSFFSNWGIYGLEYLANGSLFCEFVYTYLSPERSTKIYADDDVDQRVQEEEDARREEEYRTKRDYFDYNNGGNDYGI
jgi:hypothetical protein